MNEGESPSSPDLFRQVKSAWQKFKSIAVGDQRNQSLEQTQQRVRLVPPPRVRLKSETETSLSEHPLVSPIENVHTASIFIRAIRNPEYYQPSTRSDITTLINNQNGLEFDSQTGFFNVASVVFTASGRYSLPLAIYISGEHARLVVGQPITSTEGGTILPVYDPMKGSITTIEHPQSIPLNVGLYCNGLARADLDSGKYDLTYLNDPTLSRYRDSFLLGGKFSALQLQGDYQNCIPYCLFVGAMLSALKPDNTDFKREGISQFQQDFGVRILTREELTGVRLDNTS